MAERLFHLVLPEAWRAHEAEEWAPASLASEGFLHLSFASQLAGTCALHFEGRGEIWLLELRLDRLGDQLKLEVSRDEALFPHLYRALGHDEIAGWWRLTRETSGQWQLPRLAPRSDDDRPQRAEGAPKRSS